MGQRHNPEKPIIYLYPDRGSLRPDGRFLYLEVGEENSQNHGRTRVVRLGADGLPTEALRPTPGDAVARDPVREAAFVDGTVDLSKPAVLEGEPVYDRPFNAEQFDDKGRRYQFGVYAYRVRAVNALGVTGGASPAVLTIPSSPQSVFSKEEGPACHVRWDNGSAMDFRSPGGSRCRRRIDGWRMSKMVSDRPPGRS